MTGMGTRRISIRPSGLFSLAASTRFLEGFTPASYRRLSGARSEGAEPELRLAFAAEGSWQPAGVLVRQQPDGTVTGAVGGTAETAQVRAQVARILSLDVDGAAFPEVAGRDPVVGALIERYPGLRPVCFHSPYEAACWAVIGHRIQIRQAATIRARIAEELGPRVTVGGREMPAFPPPRTLLTAAVPGLPEIKVERLRGLARAALDGVLDAARLRSMQAEQALAALRELPGIGPFSAELVLIRGAGAPDCFPSSERRLHDSMAAAYGLADPGVAELQRIADRWRPYRSWVALLFRTDREDTIGEIRPRRPV
jgi:DNA-3-methyladenine glycosylase II